MSEKRYVVPDGMMNAACNDHHAIGVNQRDVAKMLEAALRWLSENPIVPTERECARLCDYDPKIVKFVVSVWQRLAFLAPEPEVPEAIKDLLWVRLERDGCDVEDHNKDILEAYQRGKAGH